MQTQSVPQSSYAPYPCKYDYRCKKKGKFNPSVYRCTHGGGCACPIWRRYTDREIGWYGPHER
jgi:hypothetical protein